MSNAAVDAIRRAAAHYGVTQAIPAILAVSRVESGLDPGSIGDHGTSFGLFQLHQGGALGNMSTGQARQYLDPYKNAEYAISRMAPFLKGLQGKSAVEAIVNAFERPANPQAEIARALGYLGSSSSGYGSVPGDGGTPPAQAQASSSGGTVIDRLLRQNAKLAGISNPVFSTDVPGPAASTTSGSTATGGSDGALFTGGAARSGYPLGAHGKLIGTPYSGTHTLGNWESDNAIDIAVPIGTPVIAAFNGTIGSQFGSLGEGGRFAGLRLHLVGQGNEAYYAHLSKFAPGLRPGMRVHAGQVIGYTGEANGVAHLHYAVKRGDPRS